MKNIIQLGNICSTKTRKNPIQGRVYSGEGISPSLNTCQGGYRQPMTIISHNQEGQCMSFKTINLLGNYSPSGYESSRVIDTSGIAPTVKENHGTVTGIVETISKNDAAHKPIADGVIDDTYGFKNDCRYYQDYSPTLRSERNGLKVSDNSYRVRRFTPKECWRLMGFSDENFECAKESLNKKFYNGKDKSNSQLYKQAGNSIVTDVPYYIFKELYATMPYLFEDLKVSSYFSGIGAFEIALDRLFSESTKDKKSTDSSNDKEVIVYDDYNSNIRPDQNAIGTITTNIGRGGLRADYKLIEHCESKTPVGMVPRVP